MFWAVTCESGKRYSQIPEEPFCITMAALEPREKVAENKQVSLMVEHGGKEFLLCTLEYDRVMQVNMNLKFSKGEETYFFISGEGTIHLSGHHLNEAKPAEKKKKCINDIYDQPSTSRGIPAADDDDEEDSDEDDEDEEEEVGIGTERLLALDDSDEEDSQDWNPELGKKPIKVGENVVIVCSDSEEEDDDDFDEEEEEDSEALLNEASDLEDDNDDEEDGEVSSKKRKKVLVSASSSKRPKHELDSGKKVKGNDVDHNDVSDDDEEEEEEMNSSIGHTPMRKSNVPKIKASDVSQSIKFMQGASSSNGEKSSTPKAVSEKFSHSLPSGVEYEDVRVGNGPVAKKGKFVYVFYIGKLENGRVFDSVKEGKGKPFCVRLGKHEVIAGWDVGLLGMRVGGLRNLKIPPKMGYGNKKMPGIPPNSTLYFTVNLQAVK